MDSCRVSPLQMSHTKPYIRKKAVLIMYKVFLKYPESLRPAFPRLKEKLEDPDPGIWKKLPARTHGTRRALSLHPHQLFIWECEMTDGSFVTLLRLICKHTRSLLLGLQHFWGPFPQLNAYNLIQPLFVFLHLYLMSFYLPRCAVCSSKCYLRAGSAKP